LKRGSLPKDPAFRRRIHAQGPLKTAAVREFGSDPLVFCICSRSDRSLSPAAKVLMDTVVDYCRRYH
jgi:hypothetical protein